MNQKAQDYLASSSNELLLLVVMVLLLLLLQALLLLLLLLRVKLVFAVAFYIHDPCCKMTSVGSHCKKQNKFVGMVKQG